MKPNKILTFSYDDGVTQDIRLTALLHKYGMRGTFNINSDLLGTPGTLIRGGVEVNHCKVMPNDVKYIYEGHEVAAHGRTHPHLPALSEEEIIREVEGDRLALSDLLAYEVRGFAYPCPAGLGYDRRVADILKEKTGVRYCRTVDASMSFTPPSDYYLLTPTIHHGKWDDLFRLGEEFLSLDAKEKRIFYVWGHSYEFDIADTWWRFEEFLSMMSGRSDIAYLTNSEALLGN